jgi:hypothetical protein
MFAGILSDDSDDQLLQQQLLQEEEEAKYLEPLDPFKPLIVKAAVDGIRPRRTRLGVLQSVPMVAPANEHLASALKRTSKVRRPTAAIVDRGQKIHQQPSGKHVFSKDASAATYS